MTSDAKNEEVWSVWSYELREGISSNGDAPNASQKTLHRGESNMTKMTDEKEPVKLDQINRLFLDFKIINI